MLNFGLLKNPLNWLTVLLMVLFAGFIVVIVMEYLTSLQSSQPGNK